MLKTMKHQKVISIHPQRLIRKRNSSSLTFSHFHSIRVLQLINGMEYWCGWVECLLIFLFMESELLLLLLSLRLLPPSCSIIINWELSSVGGGDPIGISSVFVIAEVNPNRVPTKYHKSK